MSILSETRCKDSPSTLSLGLPSKGDFLSKEAEVRVVREKTEHDQISVETVEAVSSVRVAMMGKGVDKVM